MRVIVTAKGSGKRWRRAHKERDWTPTTGGERCKHLVRVTGEVLLHRTVRLLREIGVDDILITARPPDAQRYRVAGAETVAIAADPHMREADQFLPRELWDGSGRTLHLSGDVYFTTPTLRAIVGHDIDDWVWYLRPWPSEWRGWSRTPVILGYSMYPGQHDYFAERIASLTELQRDGSLDLPGLRGRSHGYQLYRWMAGESVAQVADRRYSAERDYPLYPPHLWVPPADDASVDFDVPADLAEFLERYDPEADG